jgi:hypothetical protein
MRTTKYAGLGIVALAVLLTAGPALAERGDREAFRRGERMERHEREHRDGVRRGYPHWGQRRFGFLYPAPYAPRACYTQRGYWAWDGWQHLRIPPRTFCE